MKYEITSLNTKRTIANSLKKLMRNNKFAKITVSEIIEDCGINRKTFYYHFEDKYALLKWTLENEAISIVKQLDLMVDYEKAILFTMDYIEKNDYIINCVYDSIGNEELKRYFFADFAEIVKSIIESAATETNYQLTQEYEDFLCLFYTDALIGMMLDWIKRRKERDKQKTLKYIVNTVKLSLLGIFLAK